MTKMLCSLSFKYDKNSDFPVTTMRAVSLISKKQRWESFPSVPVQPRRPAFSCAGTRFFGPGRWLLAAGSCLVGKECIFHAYSPLELECGGGGRDCGKRVSCIYNTSTSDKEIHWKSTKFH